MRTDLKSMKESGSHEKEKRVSSILESKDRDEKPCDKHSDCVDELSAEHNQSSKKVHQDVKQSEEFRSGIHPSNHNSVAKGLIHPIRNDP